MPLRRLRAEGNARCRTKISVAYRRGERNRPKVRAFIERLLLSASEVKPREDFRPTGRYGLPKPSFSLESTNPGTSPIRRLIAR